MNVTTEYAEEPQVEPSPTVSIKLEVKSVQPEDARLFCHRQTISNQQSSTAVETVGNGLNKGQQSSSSLTSWTIWWVKRIPLETLEILWGNWVGNAEWGYSWLIFTKKKRLQLSFRYPAETHNKTTWPQPAANRLMVTTDKMSNIHTLELKCS